MKFLLLKGPQTIVFFPTPVISWEETFTIGIAFLCFYVGLEIKH